MRNFVARPLTLALGLCLAAAFFSCGRSNSKDEAGPRYYEARGIIRGFAPDHRTINIEHETILGFMPSMTMPFSVPEPKETADLRMGDAVSFRVVVTDKDSWIDQIKKIEADQVHLPQATPANTPGASVSARLHEGGAMPAFQLIDQNGKPATLETFRGHPFVLTFIFTRCPLPNFCPRMSQNFAELQKAIQDSSKAFSSARLLSISFDPKFDTPAVLKQYAQRERADPAVWTFATGDPEEIQKLTEAFSVLVQPEAGGISHSLATALIDRAGKITKIWRGNGWKPSEVIAAIEAKKN